MFSMGVSDSLKIHRDWLEDQAVQSAVRLGKETWEAYNSYAARRGIPKLSCRGRTKVYVVAAV